LNNGTPDNNLMGTLPPGRQCSPPPPPASASAAVCQSNQVAISPKDLSAQQLPHTSHGQLLRGWARFLAACWLLEQKERPRINYSIDFLYEKGPNCLSHNAVSIDSTIAIKLEPVSVCPNALLLFHCT